MTVMVQVFDEQLVPPATGEGPDCEEAVPSMGGRRRESGRAIFGSAY